MISGTRRAMSPVCHPDWLCRVPGRFRPGHCCPAPSDLRAQRPPGVCPLPQTALRAAAGLEEAPARSQRACVSTLGSCSASDRPQTEGGAAVSRSPARPPVLASTRPLTLHRSAGQGRAGGGNHAERRGGGPQVLCEADCVQRRLDSGGLGSLGLITLKISFVIKMVFIVKSNPVT